MACWVDGWLDGCVGERSVGLLDGWLGGVWLVGCLVVGSGWFIGWMNGWINSSVQIIHTLPMIQIIRTKISFVRSFILSNNNNNNNNNNENF